MQRGVAADLAHLAVTVGSLRVDHGWTRQQLADASQTNNHVVTGIESGTRDPTYTTVVKLLRALGVGALDLRAGDAPRAASESLDLGPLTDADP
jgi:transcriptional regulator with XRE-family HTH domain